MRMKISVRTSSGIVGLVCWVIASGLAVFVFAGIRDRGRLIRDNDNERIFNLIFTGFRGYDGVGAAIEGNPVLSERIAGFGVYGEDLTANYRWGDAPAVFNTGILETQEKNRFNRYTIQDQKQGRVKFVLHHERVLPAAPPRMPGSVGTRSAPAPADAEAPAGADPKRPAEPNPSWPGERRVRPEPQAGTVGLFTPGTYVYIDIAHPAYWRTQAFTAALFPLCEIALFAAAFYIRRLYLRNREYRERIEAQKNLVVLGTAASTLAHEIKNPLLSIRLQTGILKKTLPQNGQEEVAIIEEEVERLSELIYRVSDFLREPEGNRTPIQVYDMVRDSARRLCGRDIVRQESFGDMMIYMDPYRARSVFENILRNALESGGPPEEIGVFITRNGGYITITVLDRGKGISDADLKRVFDPFFTRKSTGTGIGLGVSKRFVEAVKGKITLTQRDGGGTAVRITLPEWIPEGIPEFADRGVG